MELKLDIYQIGRQTEGSRTLDRRDFLGKIAIAPDHVAIRN